MQKEETLLLSILPVNISKGRLQAMMVQMLQQKEIHDRERLLYNLRRNYFVLYCMIWRKYIFCKYICYLPDALSYIIYHCPNFSNEQITYGENGLEIIDRLYHIISRQVGSHLYL